MNIKALAPREGHTYFLKRTNDHFTSKHSTGFSWSTEPKTLRQHTRPSPTPLTRTNMPKEKKQKEKDEKPRKKDPKQNVSDDENNASGSSSKRSNFFQKFKKEKPNIATNF